MTQNRIFLSISTAYVVAFISLRHLIHELHEFAHMITGRIICGSWGSRDFNNVQAVADKCSPSQLQEAWIALSGPFTNYALMWMGAMVLINSSSAQRKAWGFTLIMVALPFARFITAFFGGGDEMGVAANLVGDRLLARIITVAIVLAIMSYPLFVAYRSIQSKGKVWYFLGFLFIPMLIEGAVVLWFFNYLLGAGLFHERLTWGAPALVIYVLGLIGIVFLFTHRNIPTLYRSS
jgi:hypothetical protein